VNTRIQATRIPVNLMVAGYRVWLPSRAQAEDSGDADDADHSHTAAGHRDRSGAVAWL